MLGRTDHAEAMTLASLLLPAPGGLPGRRVETPGWVGQLTRFGVVGGVASVLQLAAYTFLADSVGSLLANVLSWLVSTLVATEAHRRFSFGGSRSGSEGDHVVGVVTALLTLVLSAAALAGLDDPSGAAGVLALVVVNGLVGGLRFVALRWWMVRRPSRRSIPAPAVPAPEPVGG